MDYATYKTQIATMTVIDEDDPNFVITLPSAIEYATLRMCRDIDFLSTVATSVVGFTPLNRTLTIGNDLFVTLQQINVLTPVGTSDPSQGTRNTLLPVSKEYLDMVWPSSTGATVPDSFAMLNQATIIVGPWPDAAYSAELVGTQRPAMLSEANQNTFISTYLPDLFVQASMIYISEYQRNFSSASANDPQMPVNYESQYKGLLVGASIEEARKKFSSVGWTSMSPSPVATPTRG